MPKRRVVDPVGIAADAAWEGRSNRVVGASLERRGL